MADFYQRTGITNHYVQQVIDYLRWQLPEQFQMEIYRRYRVDEVDPVQGRFWFKYKDQIISVICSDNASIRDFVFGYFIEIFPNKDGEIERFDYNYKHELKLALVDAVLAGQTYHPPEPDPNRPPLVEVVRELKQYALKLKQNETDGPFPDKYGNEGPAHGP